MKSDMAHLGRSFLDRCRRSVSLRSEVDEYVAVRVDPRPLERVDDERLGDITYTTSRSETGSWYSRARAVVKRIVDRARPRPRCSATNRLRGVPPQVPVQVPLRFGAGFAGVVRRGVATHPSSRRVRPTARTRFNLGLICRELLQPAKLREQPRDDAREENPVER